METIGFLKDHRFSHYGNNYSLSEYIGKLNRNEITDIEFITKIAKSLIESLNFAYKELLEDGLLKDGEKLIIELPNNPSFIWQVSREIAKVPYYHYDRLDFVFSVHDHHRNFLQYNLM